jgi:uncharacterized protein (DUF3084 family)
VAATEHALAELLARDLTGTDLVALMVDGVLVAGHCCVVALGITADGTKLPLGLAEGATENATVVTALLAGLRDRGLDTTRPVLVVIDGATALRRAVTDVFDHPVIQRCQLHKLRNVADRLPDHVASTVAKRMRRAYHQPDPLVAQAELEALARELEERRRRVAEEERELEPQLQSAAERERAVELREQELEERLARQAAAEEQLNRRAARIAVMETRLSHRVRDQRELERREAAVMEGERELAARRAQLEPAARELDERGGWLAAALAQLDERERALREREREVRRIQEREAELELWEARLSDRDRRLTEMEEEIVGRLKFVRESEIRLGLEGAGQAG